MPFFNTCYDIIPFVIGITEWDSLGYPIRTYLEFDVASHLKFGPLNVAHRWVCSLLPQLSSTPHCTDSHLYACQLYGATDWLVHEHMWADCIPVYKYVLTRWGDTPILQHFDTSSWLLHRKAERALVHWLLSPCAHDIVDRHWPEQYCIVVDYLK